MGQQQTVKASTLDPERLCHSEVDLDWTRDVLHEALRAARDLAIRVAPPAVQELLVARECQTEVSTAGYR